MNSPQELQEKVHELRGQMIEVMEAFSRANPGIPAQAVMAALGELLMQLSVSQVGKAEALRFIGHLQEAVEAFGGKISPQH